MSKKSGLGGLCGKSQSAHTPLTAPLGSAQAPEPTGVTSDWQAV